MLSYEDANCTYLNQLGDGNLSVASVSQVKSRLSKTQLKNWQCQTKSQRDYHRYLSWLIALRFSRGGGGWASWFSGRGVVKTYRKLVPLSPSNSSTFLSVCTSIVFYDVAVCDMSEIYTGFDPSVGVLVWLLCKRSEIKARWGCLITSISLLLCTDVLALKQSAV
jgi:hypothetical protein